MFTGIVETIGTITSITTEGTNCTFGVTSTINKELKIDQSVSHNVVCLTVIKTSENTHYVTLIAETLSLTSLVNAVVGDSVNLERCMPANGRFDGHVVQGHVDTTAICTHIEDQNGSWLFDFSFPAQFNQYMVDKGSICVNGTSLTCFNVKDGSFRVAIIPYTYNNTVFKDLKVGSVANLEFDIIGKYVAKIMAARL